MNDLTEALYVGNVDQGELEQVLLGVLGMCAHLSANEVIYHRQDEPYALKLVYSVNRLQSLEAGPGLKAGDLKKIREKIQSELLASSPQRIGRSVLFSTYPVNGYYQAAQFFQILPVPSQAPQLPFIVGGHPFLIEFTFRSSSNPTININRRMREASELTMLRNTILEGTITRLGNSARHHWVILPHGPGEKINYGHLQEGYSYEGFRFENEHFTSLEGLGAIKPAKSPEYFAPRILPGHFLEVPNSMNQLVTRYFSLTKETQQRFLRSTFWFQQSTQANSRSAALLSLIYAIDALVPPDTTTSACPICKQSRGKSLTAQFVEFLETLVPETGDTTEGIKSARREMMRLRGDLVHGRDLLSGDRRPWAISFNPEGISEMEITLYARNLARHALVNWLLGQAPYGTDQ